MLALSLALRPCGSLATVALGGGEVVTPQPLVTLPPLTTAGASYHAVYALSRLMPGYAGPLASVVTGGSNTDVASGKAELAAGDLPAGAMPIRGLYDQTGGGRDLQQTVPARQPRVRAEVTVGRRLAVAFAGIAYDSTASSLSAPQTVASTGRSEFFLVDPSTSLQSAVWSEHASGGSVIRDAYVSSATGTFEAAQTDSARHVHAGPQVVGIVESGPGNATLYLDGAAIPIADGKDLGTSTQVTIGASVFGQQFNANLRLGAYVSVAGALSATDAQAVSAALLARFGVVTDYSLNIVHVGDSIVQGIGGEDTLALRAVTDRLLTRRARWWNLGIAGKSLAACYADRAKNEGVLAAAGKTNLALIDAGINDIGFGTDPQALYSGTTMPYVAALKAMGYKVGVVTLLPQGSANYPLSADAIDTRRLAYNDALRGNAAGADVVIDRAADATMGRYPASCQDPTLYSQTISGAGIHPTTLGYRRLAPVYAAAINAL